MAKKVIASTCYIPLVLAPPSLLRLCGVAMPCILVQKDLLHSKFCK